MKPEIVRGNEFRNTKLFLTSIQNSRTKIYVIEYISIFFKLRVGIPSPTITGLLNNYDQ